MKRNWLQISIALYVALYAAGLVGQTPHTATYTITSPQCTTATPCTAAIYRVVIPNGNCPSAWDAKYIQVQGALPGTTVASTGTTWNYVDSGASLTSGSVYCGYSTVVSTAGGAPSQASAVFQGQIPQTLNAPVISVQLK